MKRIILITVLFVFAGIAVAEDAPGRPTGFQASDGTFEEFVRMTWNPVDGASVYRVFRCADTVNPCGNPIGFPKTTSFDDLSAEPGVTYFYRVKACNTKCSSFSIADSGFAAVAQEELILDYEIEPNNDSTQATLLISGHSIKGNLGSDDIDMFRYTATTWGAIRVLFRQNSPDEYEPMQVIRVLDKDGIELASVEGYVDDVSSTFDVGVDEGEEYLIEITGYDSEIYELMVVQLPTPVFESELNGSIEMADVIPPNAWVFGQHASVTDDDYFEVELPSAGNLFVRVTRPFSTGIDGNVAILSGDETLLNSDDFGPLPEYLDRLDLEFSEARVVLGVAHPGKYYLKLTSCQACDYSDPYQILVGFNPVTE